jgi:hypothetical protein
MSATDKESLPYKRCARRLHRPPVLWGMASGAEAGVRYVLEIVRQEFDLAMALPDVELNYARSHSAILR